MRLAAIAVMLGLVILFLSIVFLRMRGVFSEDTSI